MKKEIQQTKATKTTKTTKATTKKTTKAVKETKVTKATKVAKTTKTSNTKTELPKKGTNDQDALIEYIKNRNFDVAWEKVKFIGYLLIKDMEDRHIFFQPIAELFDYTKSNNFIQFYLQRLGYIKSTQNVTYLTTCNRNYIKQLLRQEISPDEDSELTKTVRELRNWNTGGIID